MSKRREKNKPHNELNKQLEPAVERVKEKDENKIQLGKFFYSLSGLTYAGAVLALVMEHESYKVDDLIKGILATVMFAVIGWGLVKTGNIKR